MTERREHGVAVGQTLSFGRYPQADASGSTAEAIAWRVLDVQPGRALLLSDRLLDAAPYHEKRSSVTWAGCSLRKWLNDAFLNRAFLHEEQARVSLTDITEGGQNSLDRVFLLSLSEARRYFESNKTRQCATTAYAAARNPNVPEPGRETWWWLRSAGCNDFYAASVEPNGNDDPTGDRVDEWNAVRPALWLDTRGGGSAITAQARWFSGLRYKVRGDSSPRGKRKVYFCCHPDDFVPCFDSVADDILREQNCAVWYDGDPGAARDEAAWLRDLLEMNLFVLPVTTKLLVSASRAMDVELAFARENHIPVLPLMQESGLEELFNQKCGNLQALHKLENQRDPTAISYEEKLRQFLNAVLVSDALAEKVRQAFYAYIFLSYRKKDRKYARELMELIHENGFCRDIAIWYDEFLTPGDSFDVSIQKALDQSDLFAMVVTPNVVNEQNYILSTEYPMARERHKVVLPVSLVETDRELLLEKCAGIPECTDAHDREALSNALADALERLRLEKRSADPRHDFFIGLAYLNGIDVEKNADRAVRLITAAANAGVPQAMEKLTELYEHGQGVARDRQTAIEWTKRLAAQYRREYEEKGREEAGNYLYGLWRLGQAYREARLFTDAETQFSEMARVCREASGETDRFLSDLGVSYACCGDIATEKGELNKAAALYRDALAIAVRLTKAENAPPRAFDDLAVAYYKAGDSAKQNDDWAGAEEAYQKGLAVAERLMSEQPSQRFQRLRLTGYERASAAALKTRDIKKALSYARRHLEGAEALAKEYPSEEADGYLLLSYSILGDIAVSEHDDAAAEAYYRQSLALVARLAEETGSFEARRNEAILHNRLGDVALKTGRLREATEMFQKAMAIHRQTLTETGSLQAMQDLAISNEKLGGAYKDAGDFGRARQRYQECVELRARVNQQLRSVQSADHLAGAYLRLGMADEHRRDSAALGKARQLWAELAARCGENAVFAERAAALDKLLEQKA